MTPQLARSAWGSLETLHVVAFFAPEVQQAYDRFAVPATRAGYFAARSSAFGAADPALVVATFYVFSPDLVARAVPAVWAAGTPGEWATARRGWRPGAGGVAAVEAQVHVQGVGAEAGEQVLAVGGHLVEHPAVEQRRAGGEAALRAGDVHGAAGEGERLVPGQPVERVSLRHGRLGRSCPQLHP